MRPTISSAPASITYGSTFAVQTPNTDIGSVVLIKPGSVTHSFDMDQRFVGLSFTVQNGGLTAVLPQNSNLTPAGHYKPFFLKKICGASISKIVQVAWAPAPVAANEFK